MPGDLEAEGPQEERRQERLRILDLSAVGLAFPIALLLGYFGGRTIGDWLGAAQAGAMIGTLLGIAGGFYNLFKMVSRLAPRTGGVSEAELDSAGEPPKPAPAARSRPDRMGEPGVEAGSTVDAEPEP